MIATVNPATGDCLATFDTLTESQLDEKLARARRSIPSPTAAPPSPNVPAG